MNLSHSRNDEPPKHGVPTRRTAFHFQPEGNWMNDPNGERCIYLDLLHNFSLLQMCSFRADVLQGTLSFILPVQSFWSSLG
ncbi:hypothetical protein CLOM_g17481 [Closterium sp. NIES-68]|nr:hypothetical protein CLOM_g17481 [Closterium sp. NIES-68]